MEIVKQKTYHVRWLPSELLNENVEAPRATKLETTSFSVFQDCDERLVTPRCMANPQNLENLLAGSSGAIQEVLLLRVPHPMYVWPDDRQKTRQEREE